jgi:hypothetical protein
VLDHLLGLLGKNKYSRTDRGIPYFFQEPYSSYGATLSSKPSRIQRAAVLDWFDGRAGCEETHLDVVDEGFLEALIADD